MDQHRPVDDEEPVMEQLGFLDRKRVTVLCVEARHIDVMEQPLAPVLHNKLQEKQVLDAWY